MVMLGEDIPKQMKENGMLQCYPGREESDDEDLDALAESYDIQMGMQDVSIISYYDMYHESQISIVILSKIANLK